MSGKKRLLSPLKASNDYVDNKKQKVHTKVENIELKETADCLAQFFDEDDFDFEISHNIENLHNKNEENCGKLDLTEWQRCIVEHLELRRFELVLKVNKDIQNDKENGGNGKDTKAVATCHLQGPWAHTRISVEDVVSLQAIWDENIKAYKIDKDQGFCIIHADLLLSGTTVVGSLFCRRKAVLSDRFRGIDGNNKVMVVGSLVHELLQTTLSRGLSSLAEIESAATELLQSKDIAYMLYESALTSAEIKLEVSNFVPNIEEFVKRYVKTKGSEQVSIDPQNFQGTITDIADIEENLWVPSLGLKGKIDVSVRINRNRHNKLGAVASSKHAIPLELKTGRASFSMEHKGQLILYQMMLKAIGREINSSGLLLYLREGILREIRSGRNEQRDLVTLRNELAYYLSRNITPMALDKSIVLENGKLFQPFELPEPINHHSACSNCAYVTICCAFAKTDAELTLQQNHPLMKLMPQVSEHLQLDHYKYFMHWCTLLALEDQNESKTQFQRALWTETAESRQAQGRAVLGLRLHGTVERKEMRFIHTLQIENVDIDLTLSGFSIGEYVIVSTAKRLSIAAGFLENLTPSTLAVSLERDLRQNYSNLSFIVDKHESQNTQIFNYTNLGLLLDDTARSADLREIIVNKKAPTFLKSLPKIIVTKGKEIIGDLNSLQRSAALKALTTESFMLIKGLPGTGKTQTLVAIVRLLDLLGKSVIITSHTHSAVDNLLLRLKPYNLKMLRLGNAARIHPELESYAESVLMKDCKTEHDLAEHYAAYNIIGVTCLGSAHSVFLHRRFDYCIVDEATQVLQPTVLRPLYFCAKFVLVGDPDQLAPLIRSKEAYKRGADESLFRRLDSSEATSVLSLQYRMNKTITKLANELTYAGALKCGSNAVEMSTLKTFPAHLTNTMSKWLLRTLQTHIDQSVFLLDTLDCFTRSLEFAQTKRNKTYDAIEQNFAEDALLASQRTLTKKRTSKYTNYCEAAIVFQIVKALLKAGNDATRIGIIAPYRAQVELLKRLITQFDHFFKQQTEILNFNAVEVNTVDQYQGRDKDIIIYSGCKTGGVNAADMERSREAEILEDKRRLTVAITRAKQKLILIADAACLEQYTPFKTLFARIPSFCKLRLEEAKLGFEWQQILDDLAQVI